MDICAKLKSFREKRRLSTNDLSTLTGISQSVISKLENGKRKADLETISKIAEALNVPVSAFTGESLERIIESQSRKINITKEELSNKAQVTASFLDNVDDIIPDLWDYESVTRIAQVLKIHPSILRNALASQEAPEFEGPEISAKNAFPDNLGNPDTLDKPESHLYDKAKEIAIVGGFLISFDKPLLSDWSGSHNLITLEDPKTGDSWHVEIAPYKFCEWLINAEKECEEYKKQLIHEKIKNLGKTQLLLSNTN